MGTQAKRQWRFAPAFSGIWIIKKKKKNRIKKTLAKLDPLWKNFYAQLSSVWKQFFNLDARNIPSSIAVFFLWHIVEFQYAMFTCTKLKMPKDEINMELAEPSALKIELITTRFYVISQMLARK